MSIKDGWNPYSEYNETYRHMRSTKSTMSQVTGIVEKVGNKAVYINSVRYGAFNASQLAGATEGDQVQFMYKTSPDGKWNNIQGDIIVTAKGQATSPKPTGQQFSSGPPVELPNHYMIAKGYMNLVKTFPMETDHPDRSIVRQNCVGNATALVAATLGKGGDFVAASQQVLELARFFESYCTGELDDAERDAALEELGKAS